MKQLIALVAFLLCVPAFAGAPSCTGVTNVTTNSTYFASSSDCIINLTNPDQVGDSSTAVPVVFPHTTSAAEFTVTEASAFTTDECANFSAFSPKARALRKNGPHSLPILFSGFVTICQPEGWAVKSADSGVTVDGGSEEVLTGEYIPDPNSPTSYARESVRYVWDGVSDWVSQ